MKQFIAPRMMIVSIILMDVLSTTEFDIFVPGLPALQRQFDLSPSWSEALLSINFIGYCISIFFVGILADKYGRKPIILLGVLTFIIGGMSCLWGMSYTFLLMGRFLQGVGIAAPAILSFLIIADRYLLQKQQFFMAMLSGVANISAASAPLVGSYISLYFQWKGNFKALIILGLLVLLTTMFFIPADKVADSTETKETFLLREYISLFRSKSFLVLLVNIIFMAVPYWIFVGLAPLLYMNDLGVSLSHFGYYAGMLSLVFAMGCLFFGLIMHKYEHEKLLRFSTYLYLASLVCIIIVIWKGSNNPLLITLAFLFFIISQIIPYNLLVPVCISFFPQMRGKTSALLHGGPFIFASFFLQLAGFFYEKTFHTVGIFIAGFIFLVLITHGVVLNNERLMKMMRGVGVINEPPPLKEENNSSK